MNPLRAMKEMDFEGDDVQVVACVQKISCSYETHPSQAKRPISQQNPANHDPDVGRPASPVGTIICKIVQISAGLLAERVLV